MRSADRRARVARLAALSFTLISASVSAQQISLPMIDADVGPETFNTLGTAATGNTTVPSGWFFAESGTNANTTYSAGTGSGNAGDTWSFGAAGTPPSSERAFGGLQSGSLVPTIGAIYKNDTGV